MKAQLITTQNGHRLTAHNFPEGHQLTKCGVHAEFYLGYSKIGKIAIDLNEQKVSICHALVLRMPGMVKIEYRVLWEGDSRLRIPDEFADFRIAVTEAKRKAICKDCVHPHFIWRPFVK